MMPKLMKDPWMNVVLGLGTVGVAAWMYRSMTSEPNPTASLEARSNGIVGQVLTAGTLKAAAVLLVAVPVVMKILQPELTYGEAVVKGSLLGLGWTTVTVGVLSIPLLVVTVIGIPLVPIIGLSALGMTVATYLSFKKKEPSARMLTREVIDIEPA
jgi:uncharacterized membrane protein